MNVTEKKFVIPEKFRLPIVVGTALALYAGSLLVNIPVINNLVNLLSK